MNKMIYVKLLNEGTEVFRPDSAIKISDSIYEIRFLKKYDSEDEKWEFIPGSRVIVEEKFLEGQAVLVATKNI